MWGSTQAGETLKSHFTKITTGTWQMYEKNHSVTWTLLSLTAVLAMIQIKQPAYPITHHYWQFTTSQESHKLWHQSSFHNNFYPIIGTVCEVGNCPARVCSTSGSSWCRRRTRVGRICWMASMGGAGFLLRHRFERVHVTLRKYPDCHGWNKWLAIVSPGFTQ